MATALAVPAYVLVWLTFSAPSPVFPFLAQPLLTPVTLTVCFFVMFLQVAVSDLLVEATFSQRIRKAPRHGPSLVTFVWGGVFFWSLVSTVVSGAVLDAEKHAHAGWLYMGALFITLLLVPLTCANFLGENKTSSAVPSSSPPSRDLQSNPPEHQFSLEQELPIEQKRDTLVVEIKSSKEQKETSVETKVVEQQAGERSSRGYIGLSVGLAVTSLTTAFLGLQPYLRIEIVVGVILFCSVGIVLGAHLVLPKLVANCACFFFFAEFIGLAFGWSCVFVLYRPGSGVSRRAQF